MDRRALILLLMLFVVISGSSQVYYIQSVAQNGNIKMIV